MSSTRICALYVVFGDEEEAIRIGRAMVEERRAACANILGPCRSIYRWQGKVEEGDEVAAIFKVPEDQAAALTQAIRAEHSYDVPAIVVLPLAGGNEDYLAWVEANVGEEDP